MKTLFCLIALFISTCLLATIINVPVDQPTIQAGIDAAVDTDTVLVEIGVYYENIDFQGKAITVASRFLLDVDTLYIENTIISGSQPEDPDFGSCVLFNSGEDTTSVLTGFTLTEGTGTYYYGGYYFGGGIECFNASAKIISNIIMNNSADYAGGVDCDNSSMILMNNVISDNIAYMNMGGLSIVESSHARIKNNIILNNTADNIVGGVLIQNCSPKFENNIICYNTANYCGGLDVYDVSVSTRATIENCQIYGNTASNSRGGIQVWEAQLDVVNCQIFDNHANVDAGGIGVLENSDVEIVRTSIYNNTVGNHGGGIYVDASLTLQNCTIFNNVAGNVGSQICFNSGEFEALNTIIAGNSDNASIYFNTDAADVSFCNFYNFHGPNFVGPEIPAGLGEITTINLNGDPCDCFMNIQLDPLFVDLENDDFHLTEFSPCIDAGFPASPPDPDGSICDIGRYCFDTSGVDDPVVTPAIKLFQNHPNPFNPTTTISFELAGVREQKTGVSSQEDVELTIFNIKGQKVKTLEINCHPEFIEGSVYDEGASSPSTELRMTRAGSSKYSITWNGTDDKNQPVSSGIYFYKLKAGKQMLTRKMVLLK